MAYHLPPIQPLWSFVSATPVPRPLMETPAAPQALSTPVQAWARGVDGRPQLRFALRRRC